MKQLLRSFCIIGALLIAVGNQAIAQKSLEDKIKSMADKNARGYISPIVSGFGVAMNSGIFRSPETHSVLGFDFQIVTAMAFAASSEKKYSPEIPTGWDGPSTANTAIGSNTPSTYHNPLLPNNDIVLPGGADAPGGASGFFVAPQLTVGVPFKTDVILRFVPGIEAGDYGKVKLFGIGAKHNLNQWIPVSIPLDLAAGIFYQKLSLGSVFKASATSFDVLAGKSLNLLILKVGLYGGFGLESSSMDVKYSGDIPDQNGNPVPTNVKFSLDGKNSGRGFLGANVRLLWLLNVNAEAGFGKYRSLNVGVGLTLR